MLFEKYFNHEGGNRNIYSRKNLLGMSLEELLKRELELAYQYNTIGIPEDDDLAKSNFAYEFEDDTGKKGWRAGVKPNSQQTPMFGFTDESNVATNNLHGFSNVLSNKQSKIGDINSVNSIQNGEKKSEMKVGEIKSLTPQDSSAHVTDELKSISSLNNMQSKSQAQFQNKDLIQQNNKSQWKNNFLTSDTSGIENIKNKNGLQSENTFDRNFQNKNSFDTVPAKFGYKPSFMQEKLIDYNNEKNKQYKDARDCMNIALIGPENIQNTNDYKVISDDNIDIISSKIGYKVPKDLKTVEYSSESSLAKSLENSEEFRNQIKDWVNLPSIKKSKHMPFTISKDQNLARSLHNATLLNPKIEKDCVKGYVYDLYDYRYQSIKDFNDNNIWFANTGAYVLQQFDKLKNYYILVPVKVKL
ncbi:MAG: hypothetical protein E7Z89_07020 [Cyanobacteria bacterium SIG28]|nr:hypothetical protein [Cyanobacteria bacterium SIG28]